MHSAQSPDFSTMELDLAQIDHGPELSPAERVSELSRPQFSPSEMEKIGLGINSDSKPESSKRKRNYCWIGGLVAVLIIIVMAVALPVGLIRRGKKSR